MPPMDRRRPRGFLTDEEKQNMPKITKGLLKRILSYLLPYKWYFLLVFVALCLSAVSALYPSVITGKIVDTIVMGAGSGIVVELIKLVVLAFSVVALSQILSV